MQSGAIWKVKYQDSILNKIISCGYNAAWFVTLRSKVTTALEETNEETISNSSNRNMGANQTWWTECNCTIIILTPVTLKAFLRNFGHSNSEKFDQKKISDELKGGIAAPLAHHPPPPPPFSKSKSAPGFWSCRSTKWLLHFRGRICRNIFPDLLQNRNLTAIPLILNSRILSIERNLKYSCRYFL